jgi:hypothetical protein
MPVWEPRGQPYAAPGEIQQQSSPVHHHHSSAVSAADPHAGRFYPQIHAPAGFSTPPHAAGLSTHQQGSSFVTGTPAYSAPPHAAAGLHTQGSFVTADCYSYVDQVGNLQTAPVVSRHDVLVSACGRGSSSTRNERGRGLCVWGGRPPDAGLAGAWACPTHPHTTHQHLHDRMS